MPDTRRILTPNVDKLAAEGMRFTDAYAGYSVCAPSRRTLMTGYHVGHFAPNNGGGGMLSNSSVTVAKLLQQHGYATRLIGKWGLDGNYPKPKPPGVAFPTKQGFDGFYGQSDQYQCHDYYPPFMFNDTANLTVSKNVGASVETCGYEHSKCVWSADLWTTDAVDWVSAAGANKAPWFLYLAYTSPHAGSVGSIAENDVPVPRVSKGPYAHEANWPKVETHFATAVHEIDAAVGQVVEAVETSGQAKNTIVFFSSDNGAHQEGGHQYQFFNSSGFLNGFKRSIHDGGHRAAFIARWPGMIAAGSISAHQLCFYDFLPTAAELTGIDNAILPPMIDGHSFAPTLLGKPQAQPPFIYHDFGGPQDPVLRSMNISKSFGQNVRMGKWSGVAVCKASPCDISTPDTTFFLYDMDKDQAQLKDVSVANPDIVKQINAIMVVQFNHSHDPAMPHQTGGGGRRGTVQPGPHPAKSPCAKAGVFKSGRWWGGHNHPYSMTVDGTSALLNANIAGDHCCAWDTANATIDNGKIMAVATSKLGRFVVSPTGTLSNDGCSITWSERWAPWRLQSQPSI